MTREEREARIADLKKRQDFFYDKDIALLIELLEQEPEADGWHDSEDPPSDDRYVLLSFSNFSLPINGRYEEDEDGGGNYYIGDDTETALSQDIIVNGWMELPKCRRD